MPGVKGGGIPLPLVAAIDIAWFAVRFCPAGTIAGEFREESSCFNGATPDVVGDGMGPDMLLALSSWSKLGVEAATGLPNGFRRPAGAGVPLEPLACGVGVPAGLALAAIFRVIF